MYTEKVLDHFSHPRNMGEVQDANGVGMVGNAKCGDIMQMFIKVNDDGIIEDCGFKTFGCGAAIATSSMATEMIKGKSIDEALKLSNAAVVEALEGLPPQKIHCSVLAEEAVKSAIEDYYKRKTGKLRRRKNCGIKRLKFGKAKKVGGAAIVCHPAFLHVTTRRGNLSNRANMFSRQQMHNMWRAIYGDKWLHALHFGLYSGYTGWAAKGRHFANFPKQEEAAEKTQSGEKRRQPQAK